VVVVVAVLGAQVLSMTLGGLDDFGRVRPRQPN